MATFLQILPILLHYYQHDGNMVSRLSRLSSAIINGGYHPLYGDVQELAYLFYSKEAEDALDQIEAEALEATIRDHWELYSPAWGSDSE